ncbi:unnamed protein product [Prorocentrum cordatum]|uniref:CCHC-type domain-containing protein n=1 Tax=Prorocentrum cordatum TaxID=2364126 RepID=A0ABN9UM00_9DINO|nr:unnamed protein product [Polarella glacialis]
MATNEELFRQMQALTAEVQRLSEENARLQREQQGGLQAIPALVDAVTRLTGRPDQFQRLVDTKGIGKPSVFDGSEAKAVLEWSVERHDSIDRGLWQAAFGPHSEGEIDHIDEMVAQLHTAIQQLVTGEPFDITQNVDKGNGLECWRRLARRFDPSTGGRKRNLLKQVLSPGRCKLDELAGALERWEEAVKRYESRRGDDGNRERLSDSVRMSALESLLPAELEEHVLLNQSRLNTYELLRREIASYLEARTGARLRDAPVLTKAQRDPNAMDIGALVRAYQGGKAGKDKGGKGKTGTGKGKDDKVKKGGKGSGPGSGKGSDTSHLVCWNCGRSGHKSSDCWRPSASAEVIAKAKAKAKGKQKPKGGGKHDAGALDVGKSEEEAPGNWEPEDHMFLELFSAEREESAKEVNGGIVGDKGWVKVNFDSGCASSVIPREWTPATSAPSSQRFKTASGGIIADEGGGVLEGVNENGARMRLAGRRAAVTKPLVSASEMLKKRIGILDESCGMVIEKGSTAGRAIMKLVAKLKETGALENNIRLHQERGVYNAYLKLPEEKARELEQLPLNTIESELAHRRAEVPTVVTDYGYLNASESDSRGRDASSAITVLVMHDCLPSGTGCYGASSVPAKGKGDFSSSVAVDFFNHIGHKRCIYQSDGENPLLALKRDVCSKAEGKELLLRESPVGEHQANGAAENAVKVIKGVVRTVLVSAQAKWKQRLPFGHPLMLWAPTYAAQMLNRFKIGDDGKTSEQRRSGKRWEKVTVPFGERIQVKKLVKDSLKRDLGPCWVTGYCVGHTSRSGTALVLTSKGVQRGTEEVLGLKGKPWDWKGGEERYAAAPADVAPRAGRMDAPVVAALPAAAEPRDVGFYVTRANILDAGIGPTEGCVACENLVATGRAGVAHSELCRQRVIEALAARAPRDLEGRRGAKQARADPPPVGSSAPRVRRREEEQPPQEARAAPQPMATGGLEEVPLELQSLAFSEYCNPGCFTELAGEFGMLPGLAADISLKDRESQEALDMRKIVNQQRYMQALEDQDPYLVIGAPPCTRVSKLTSLNRGKYKDPEAHAKAEEDDRALLRFGMEVYKDRHAKGRWFLHEHPWDAKSWDDEAVKEVVSLPGVYLVRGDMCAWGLELKGDDGKVGPVKKSTGWLTNNERLAKVLAVCCPGGHRHVPLLGGGRARKAQSYTPSLRRAILQGLKEELEIAGEINSFEGVGPVPDEEAQYFKPDAPPGAAESDKWYWGDVNGGWLDPAGVRAARQEELAWMKHREVFEPSDEETCGRLTGRAPLRTRWVDTNKGDEQRPKYRSRLVAMEIKAAKKASEQMSASELFSSTPPLEAVKLLCSLMVSMGRSPRGLPLKIGFWGVSRARLYGDAQRVLFVRLPEEEGGGVARLLRSMYGTQGAASVWQSDWSRQLLEDSWRMGVASPAVFYRSSDEGRGLAHGDDFMVLGDEITLKEIETKLTERYDIKCTGILGPDSGDAKEVVFLNRVLRYVDGSTPAVEIESDQRHVELLIKELGLENESKGLDVPSVKKTEADIDYEAKLSTLPLDEVAAIAVDLGLEKSVEVVCNHGEFPVEVCGDSTAAIAFASRQGLGRQKHVMTRYLWLQSAVKAKRIKLKKVDTRENVADSLTKPLSAKVVQKHLKRMGYHFRSRWSALHRTIAKRSATAGAGPPLTAALPSAAVPAGAALSVALLSDICFARWGAPSSQEKERSSGLAVYGYPVARAVVSAAPRGTRAALAAAAPLAAPRAASRELRRRCRGRSQSSTRRTGTRCCPRWRRSCAAGPASGARWPSGSSTPSARANTRLPGLAGAGARAPAGSSTPCQPAEGSSAGGGPALESGQLLRMVPLLAQKLGLPEWVFYGIGDTIPLFDFDNNGVMDEQDDDDGRKAVQVVAHREED